MQVNVLRRENVQRNMMASCIDSDKSDSDTQQWTYYIGLALQSFSVFRNVIFQLKDKRGLARA